MNKTLIPALKMIYPYDNTAQDKGNFIADDVKVIPPNGGKVVAASKGAFYADTLIVRKGQEVLQLNRDYELAGFYQEATEETGKPVNVLVVFKDHIDGEIRMSYQVVGGIFIGVWETVQDYINILLVDPRKQRWDDILDKPELFAPMDHYHDINDTYGWDVLPYKISELTAAVTRIRSKEMRLVYDRILRIKKDSENLINTRLSSLDKVVSDYINNNSELSQLKLSIRTINDYIAVLGDANELLTKVGEIDGKITRASAKVKSDLQNNFASQFNAITGQYNDLKVKVDELNTSILRDSKKYTDGKFNTVNTGLTTAKEELTALTTKLNELKNTVDGLPTLCNQVGDLPIKEFSRGSSLLARSEDGTCYRMVTPENFYQDIGVKISSHKVSVDVNSPFNVKYIVTNSGLATNEKTLLTIVLPEQRYKTPYTVSGFEQTLQNGTRFIKKSDTQYEVYGLRSGGTFTVTFTLVPTSFGTYQLGGQVTADSSYDTDMTNNQASLILTANTVYDANYVPSVNCPMIIAKSPDGRTQYKAMKTITAGRNITVDYDYLVDSLNVVDANNLNGFKVKLENYSTVYVKYMNPENLRIRANVGYIKYIDDLESNNMVFLPFKVAYGVVKELARVPATSDFFAVSSNVKAAYTDNNYDYDPDIRKRYVDNMYTIPLDSLEANTEIHYPGLTDNFILENGVVTFKGNNKAAVLLCRPQGNNCVWQTFIFTSKTPYNLVTNTDRFDITGLSNNLYTQKSTITYSDVMVPEKIVKDKSEQPVGYFVTKGWGKGIYPDNFELIKTIKNNYTLNLRAGTVYNFTLKKLRTPHSASQPTIVPFEYPKAKGNINFTATNKPDGSLDHVTVTTTNQVSSTDNVTFDDITITFN